MAEVALSEVGDDGFQTGHRVSVVGVVQRVGSDRPSLIALFELRGDASCALDVVDDELRALGAVYEFEAHAKVLLGKAAIPGELLFHVEDPFFGQIRQGHVEHRNPAIARVEVDIERTGIAQLGVFGHFDPDVDLIAL